MKVEVFSAADKNFAPVVAATWPRMAQWCANCGYTFTAVGYVSKTECDGLEAMSWRKIGLLSEQAKPDRVNIWMDADIFVRDLNQDISAWFPQDGIAFSSDLHGLCAGFFIFKGSWALDLIRAVGWGGPVKGSRHYEQDAFKLFVKSFGSVSDRVTFIPTTIVANPEKESCPPLKAWAYHAWSSNWMRLEQEVKAALERLQLDTGSPAS